MKTLDSTNHSSHPSQDQTLSPSHNPQTHEQAQSTRSQKSQAIAASPELIKPIQNEITSAEKKKRSLEQFILSLFTKIVSTQGLTALHETLSEKPSTPKGLSQKNNPSVAPTPFGTKEKNSFTNAAINKVFVTTFKKSLRKGLDEGMRAGLIQGIVEGLLQVVADADKPLSELSASLQSSPMSGEPPMQTKTPSAHSLAETKFKHNVNKKNQNPIEQNSEDTPTSDLLL